LAHVASVVEEAGREVSGHDKQCYYAAPGGTCDRRDGRHRRRPSRRGLNKLLAEGLTPINHWGTPEDIGRAVTILAAGDLPFTTGAAIQVDGGMHIHGH
jgi:NAD(P)-dependent dehydrogenase (short-subunit alcohol dehydrogenase family)